MDTTTRYADGGSGQEGWKQVIAPPGVGALGTDARRDTALMLSTLPPDAVFMMGDNPALPRMPERPTLADFYRLRLDPFDVQHMLHSARRARELGLGDTVVLACLLHDIAVSGVVRSHHGHWGAQLIEPYVAPEVVWAVRLHEVLRYFPDESVGYAYPAAYDKFFGPDFRPPAYMREIHERAREHRWYMSARLVTVNDVYTFDRALPPLDVGEFEDVIGRGFRQPVQGLGFDGSPVAHMWRTMIWPNNFL